MMKKLIFTSFLILITASIHPQIVVTEPEFPTENDSIVVTFDATQPGAEELLNYTGTVYAHTGVITNMQIDRAEIIADSDGKILVRTIDNLEVIEVKQENNYQIY